MSYAASLGNNNSIPMRAAQLRDNIQQSGLWTKIIAGEQSLSQSDLRSRAIQGGYRWNF